MSTYYYQGAQILAPLSITSNEPMFDMTTVSLKTQRASQGYQRWELSFDVVADSSNQADLFLSSFQDLETAGTMVMPQLTSVTDNENYIVPTSGATNVLTLTLAGSASAGASAVTITNDNGSGSAKSVGTLPKGSFISFNNHDKVYIVTADVVIGNNTNSYSVSIHPKLKTNLTTSNVLEAKDSCQITHYRDINNATGISFSDGVLSSIGSVSLIEAL
jgi:hypothetical protein